MNLVGAVMIAMADSRSAKAVATCIDALEYNDFQLYQALQKIPGGLISQLQGHRAFVEATASLWKTRGWLVLRNRAKITYRIL
jgi:hypothetical protein